MKREVTQAEVNQRKKDTLMALGYAFYVDLDYITADMIANEPTTIIEPVGDFDTAVGHHLRTGIVEGNICWLIDSDIEGQAPCGTFTLTLKWTEWLHEIDLNPCDGSAYNVVGRFVRKSSNEKLIAE